MINEIISRVESQNDIEENEAYELCKAMMSGGMDEADIGTVLLNLAAKGETIDEITGMAQAMREVAVAVDLGDISNVIDTCGTGGSGLSRINTSTISAFVLAAGGVNIAKHGNKASSGRCGSFDLMESLGAKIDLGPDQAKKTFDTFGIALLFAPLYHPAMRHVGPVRKKLGIRTIFNFLGPLANPAGVLKQVLGVSDLNMAEKMSRVLRNLGSTRALIVHGHDKLDEITLSGKTEVFEINGTDIDSYSLTSEDIGLAIQPLEAIASGSVDENVNFCRKILSGELRDARRDLVCANSGAGLYLAGKTPSIKEGVAHAQKIIESGKAKKLLDNYIQFTQTL